MKTIFVLLAFFLSSTASAACYVIYSASGELVWRGQTPPVPMNAISLDDEVHKLVPKGHLVIGDSTATSCAPLDLTARTTMKQKAEAIKND